MSKGEQVRKNGQESEEERTGERGRENMCVRKRIQVREEEKTGG